MAEKKQMDTTSKIDALYSWISYDLQKIKGELMNEMKYSSVQVGSLYRELKNDRDKSSSAISQEIRYSYKQNQTIYDGLAQMLSVEVAQRLQSIDEKFEALTQLENTELSSISELDEKSASALAEVKEKIAALEESAGNSFVEWNEKSDAGLAELKEKIAQIEETINELKYSYMQHQAIYQDLTALVQEGVIAKVDEANLKLDSLAKLEDTLDLIHGNVVQLISLYEDNDYKALIESIAEKTEASVENHSKKVLDAVAAIPVAENVDYNRIVDEVGDRMLEILGEVVQDEPVAPAAPVDAKVDYDRLIYGTAEKVVESLPYPEKVDYRRINDSFQKAAESVKPEVVVEVTQEVFENAVTAAVEKAMAALNVEAIAQAVAERVVVPVVEPEAIDYERLADMVAERIAANTPEAPVVDPVDYDRIAALVEEKLAVEEEEEVTYNLVLDEEGIQAIAQGVAQEMCQVCAECAPCQEPETEEQPVEEVVEEQPVEEAIEEVVEEQPVEEIVEEVVEEQPVEEVVEEQPVEEPTEEVVEEQPVEELVEEQPVVETAATEELAVSQEPIFDENGEQLVDAETGLVIRLKKSFTAKMKQSEERVKGYYSDIKNELTSYKKINSNVSWHGDRFNFGRDTVAKVNICGKTLCFYLALDPEDPELKSTVYHQKNVGNQKAYENTPFMVKIKSDAAAKKALRLVGYLAEKLGTEKDESFENVDYINEYAYQSTKQLYEEGFIKVTKEKKVDLDF